jgi:hypothetical protein
MVDKSVIGWLKPRSRDFQRLDRNRKGEKGVAPAVQACRK